MGNIINTITSSRIGTRFWKACTSSLQKTSQTKIMTNPMHNIGDTFFSNNPLEVFKRNNPQLSGDILVKFEELVTNFSARGNKNKTQEAFNKLVNNVFTNKDYTNEQDILKYITGLNGLFKKRTPQGENLLDANIVHFLADFKNRSLSNKELTTIRNLIIQGENGTISQGELTSKLNIYRFLPNLGNSKQELRDEAYNLIKTLHKRKPENVTKSSIQKIFDDILNRPSYSSQEDKIKYISNLQKLFSKQAPNGEYILKGKDVSYLADFKNRNIPEKKLKDIKKVIWACENGYLPSNILKQFGVVEKKLLHNCSGINPQIISDIEKLHEASRKGIPAIDMFIPKLKGAADTIEGMRASKNIKVGDMYSFEIPDKYGNTVFIRTSEVSSTPIRMSREECFEMLNPASMYHITQGKTGTCYQLASYISMLSNPITKGNILRCIGREGDKLFIELPFGEGLWKNEFACRFKDIDRSGSVKVYLKDNKFIAQNKEQTSNANEIIKAMEQLYGKHRKYNYADMYIKQLKQQGKYTKEALNDACNNMEKYIYIEKNGVITRTTLDEVNKQSNKKFVCVEDYYKESGCVHEVFKAFAAFKDRVGGIDTDGKTIEEIRTILKKDNTLKTFGTIPKNKYAESTLLEDKYLVSSHAYNITGYNPQEDIVTYINPWNSLFTFDMKLNELSKYIDSIGTWKQRA